jgi:hypothetical protein
MPPIDPCPRPNTFSRPSTPKMWKLQRFTLNEARNPANNENDVWIKTTAKAEALWKEPPSLLEIRKVLAHDLEARFPGNQARFTQIPIVAADLPKFKPTPSSSAKRTASAMESPEENQPSKRARGRTTDTNVAAEKSFASRLAFVDKFSPENWQLSSAVAIREFNKTVPEDEQLKPATQNYEICKQKHNNVRWNMRHHLKDGDKPNLPALMRVRERLARKLAERASSPLSEFLNAFSYNNLPVPPQEAVNVYNALYRMGKTKLEKGTAHYKKAIKTHKNRRARASKPNNSQPS